jgi:hypothetical protein
VKCEARQYSDQMHCSRCSQVWDINDSNPPACKRMRDRNRGDADMTADTITWSGAAAVLAVMLWLLWQERRR